jgi:prepilin peptidase CpaA
VTPLWSSLVLGLLLIAAAAIDIRERRVPNRLNVAILLLGLLLSHSWPLTTDAVAGSLAGVAVGMAIWFPMYLFRLVGAGDVKLLAASGAWLGLSGTVTASLVTALAGGLLGLVWIVVRQGFAPAFMAVAHALRAPSLLQLRPFDRRDRVPYALAIAAGVWFAWLGCTGWLALARGGCR